MLHKMMFEPQPGRIQSCEHKSQIWRTGSRAGAEGRAAPICWRGGARAWLRVRGAACAREGQRLATEAVCNLLQLVCDRGPGARQRLLQVLVRRVVPHFVADEAHAVRQAVCCTGDTCGDSHHRGCTPIWNATGELGQSTL